LLAASVLPTPVGPLNRNEPIGLFTAGPERHFDRRGEHFEPCPGKHDALRSRSMVCSLPRSSFDTLAGNARDLATISSTSVLLMVFLRLFAGRMRWAAPASSMTSIALSGR
jgi:hypothetical protein